jgi:hypothetical protein
MLVEAIKLMYSELFGLPLRPDAGLDKLIAQAFYYAFVPLM